MGTKDDGTIRSFDTGATRDTAEGKLDLEGFTHPMVMKQFAKFMNMHRLQSDGNLRDSDNWQKGIPINAYMKSLDRHFQETWQEHRGFETENGQIANLCGIMFNAMGYLLEYLKERDFKLQDFDGDEPIPEHAERRAMIAEKQEAKVPIQPMVNRYAEWNYKWGTEGVEGNYPTLKEAVGAVLKEAESINSIKLDVNVLEEHRGDCMNQSCTVCAFKEGCEIVLGNEEDEEDEGGASKDRIYGFTGMDSDNECGCESCTGQGDIFGDHRQCDTCLHQFKYSTQEPCNVCLEQIRTQSTTPLWYYQWEPK